MPKISLSDFIIVTAQDDEVASAFAKALERKINEAPKKKARKSKKEAK